MKRLSVFVAILLGFAFALTACGGSGPSTNISVDMMEFMFSPSDFTVPAGQEITIKLSNSGAVMHDFIIMKYGTEVGQEFDEEDEPNVYWKAELEPGTSETLTFTAPSEPGEYQVACGIEGHFQAGMVAKLFVAVE